MLNRVPLREYLFGEGPEGITLIGNRCKTCGQVFFPKVAFCFTCFGKNLEELKLSRRGKLYSYTIGRMAAMHFEPPYAIGYIDMPEGIRIFAPLIMVADRPFQIGMEMQLVIEKVWQEGDKEVIGYKFKPVISL